MNKSQFIKDFKKKYSVDDIKNYINSIEDLKILTVGETIIDEYQYGYTLGKAGKFPIVAFQNENLEEYEGGVVAIYNHLKDFCDVDFMTDKDCIIKKRYVQNGQKLFESYRNEKNPRWSIYVDKSHMDIGDYDLVIVADFGHGFVDKELRDKIREESYYIALNTQLNAGNEGLNTIQKYNYRANYICIDSHELRLAYSNQEDSLEDIIKDNFVTDVTVSITRGKKGCIVYRHGEMYNISPFTTDVLDAVGAGDAFLSITAPLAYKGVPLDVIGFVGNCVGALAVKYSGNKECINKSKLFKFIEELLG